MGVPYTIVKGKARLGTVVGRKTSSVVRFSLPFPILFLFEFLLMKRMDVDVQLAFGEVKSEDKAELAKLVSAIKSNYTDKNAVARTVWGGGHRGHKSQFPSLSFFLSFFPLSPSFGIKSAGADMVCVWWG